MNCLAQLTAQSLQGVEHLVVLGRGPGYAISREIALKFKEVCGIHAEAFSSAEFLHGPVTLVKDQFAIVDVSIADEANAAHQAQIAEVRSRGAPDRGFASCGLVIESSGIATGICCSVFIWMLKLWRAAAALIRMRLLV